MQNDLQPDHKKNLVCPCLKNRPLSSLREMFYAWLKAVIEGILSMRTIFLDFLFNIWLWNPPLPTLLTDRGKGVIELSPGTVSKVTKISSCEYCNLFLIRDREINI